MTPCLDHSSPNCGFPYLCLHSLEDRIMEYLLPLPLSGEKVRHSGQFVHFDPWSNGRQQMRQPGASDLPFFGRDIVHSQVVKTFLRSHSSIHSIYKYIYIIYIYIYIYIYIILIQSLWNHIFFCWYTYGFSLKGVLTAKTRRFRDSVTPWLRICLAGLIYGRLSMRRGSKYGALGRQLPWPGHETMVIYLDFNTQWIDRILYRWEYLGYVHGFPQLCWCPKDSVQLVNISPISLWFMVDILTYLL